MLQQTLEFSPVDCRYCQGVGQVNGDECRACRGAGNVMVAQPPRSCAHCNGKGRKSAYRCNSCRGTGWAHSLV